MPRLSPNYDEDADRDYVKDLLWSSGLKVTKPRLSVVKFLFSEKNPLSIVEIKNKLPKIGNASIYRILEVLVSNGHVNRINTGRIHSSYEILRGRKHHHHIICTKCDEVEDVEGLEKCPVKNLTEYIETSSKKFSIIYNHSLEFFGLCKKCSQ